MDTGAIALNVIKLPVPTIYLDSNVLILLARYEKGTCKDAHKTQIGKLYDILTTAKRDFRILCPMGNQQEEIGVSGSRPTAKEFVLGFTNSDLLSPRVIKEQELDCFYQAFMQNIPLINLYSSNMFSPDLLSKSLFRVRVSVTYKKEKLDRISDGKQNCIDILNEMKRKGNRCKDFPSQLETELASAKELLLSAMETKPKTVDDVIKMSDILGPVYGRLGTMPSDEDYVEKMLSYLAFLCSPYYRLVPYAWIESVIWATRMQSDKKIAVGDNMDTIWASAYLPFLDYFVTDDAFSRLLNDSGLTTQYNVQVYSLKNIDALINTLSAKLC